MIFVIELVIKFSLKVIFYGLNLVFECFGRVWLIFISQGFLWSLVLKSLKVSEFRKFGFIEFDLFTCLQVWKSLVWVFMFSVEFVFRVFVIFYRVCFIVEFCRVSFLSNLIEFVFLGFIEFLAVEFLYLSSFIYRVL